MRKADLISLNFSFAVLSDGDGENVPCQTLSLWFPSPSVSQKNATEYKSAAHPLIKSYFCLLSHCWLAIPQLVLHADWQDVWHSPQPPFFAEEQRFFVSIVLIRFIICTSCEFVRLIISRFLRQVNIFIYKYFISANTCSEKQLNMYNRLILGKRFELTESL